MRMGRILVTGGNGRLGGEVLSLLGERGVAGVRRGAIADSSRLLVIDGDSVIDPARLAGFDAVINCAGRVTGTANELLQANVDYPLLVARAAREAGVARFVQVSSFSVYGRTPHIDANTPLAPESDYGRSKLAAEQALAALHDQAFYVTSLRLPFMFSAAEPALLRPLVKAVLRARVLPTLYGKPSRRSILTYAGAADALIRIATQTTPAEAVQIAADPKPLALTAVAQAIRARLTRTVLIIPVPTVLGRWLRPLAPATVDRLFGSSLLDPSVNMLAAGTAYPVEADLYAYLERLA